MQTNQMNQFESLQNTNFFEKKKNKKMYGLVNKQEDYLKK